jgi:hypothetical protein
MNRDLAHKLTSLAAAALEVASELAREPQPAPEQPVRPEPERMLTPDEAAAIARVSRETVYGWARRADWRPFTRRISRKVLRIEERGFRRWLERRTPGLAG